MFENGRNTSVEGAVEKERVKAQEEQRRWMEPDLQAHGETEKENQRRTYE